MTNQIINIFFMTISGILQGIALEYMLDKNERINKWIRLMYWTILGLIPSMINVMISSSADTVMIRNAAHWIMAGIALFVFYTGPIWKRLIAEVIVYFSMLCGELIMHIVVQFTDIDIQTLFDKTRNLSTFFVGCATFITVILIFAIVFVWRFANHKGNSMRWALFFLWYMFSFIITLVIMEGEILRFDLSVKTGWAVVTSIICEIALLIVMFSQSEKESLEHKLIEEKHKEELESIHYKEIELRRNVLKELSEKNGKDLSEVQTFLLNENSVAAKEKLGQMLARIELTKEYPFCSIPIVNAILSEKQRICESSGIMFQTEILMPDEMKIMQMELCSVIGNLLDNSIRECTRILEESVKREVKIQFRAATKGEYLIVKCVNPARRAPGKVPEGTGYGLKIIREIAEKYNGTMKSEYKEGEFSVVVSFQFR